MIKKYLMFLLLFTAVTSSAQENTCDKKVNNLLIDKVKSFNSKDLIPYFSEKENKWGYMDRVSKKIITTPIFNAVYFFQPYLQFESSFEDDQLTKGCNGKIAGSSENYTVKSLKTTDYQAYTMPFDGYEEVKKNYQSMIKNTISGFELDADGKVSFLNSKFYDEANDKSLILEVFQFKNKYYAITKTVERKKEYYNVIDQKGNGFAGFKKLEPYPRLKQIYSNDKDVWFLLEINNNKYVYRSLFENRQLNDTIDDRTVYGQNQTQSLGYVIYTSNKKKGVFDLTTMNWRIPPSEKNDFSYLYYSCSDPLLYSYDKKEYSYRTDVILSSKMINENRAKSYIYIQTSNKDFYDLDFKIYIPEGY